MIDPRAKTFAVYVSVIVAAIAVLGVVGVFVYALLSGRVVVPDPVANGFWQVVLGLLTLVLVVVIPFVRDRFAASQRQLTQAKIDATNDKIDATAAAVADIHQVVTSAPTVVVAVPTDPGSPPRVRGQA